MSSYASAPRLVTFTAGADGAWAIQTIAAITGETLALAPRLAVAEADAGSAVAAGAAAAWHLSGFTSNMRYTESAEYIALSALSAGLARPEASRAAMIAIRKTPAWWALAQNARRAVFEAQSQHIGIGMDYLPGVARRLHHSRDLGEPYDFLTWFEYAPEHADAFNAMVARLRATPEWKFVDRETDVRLIRADAAV
jgi:chlorite dismutase